MTKIVVKMKCKIVIMIKILVIVERQERRAEDAT